MADETVQVGQQVRLIGEHQRGTVAEIDRAYHAARLQLNSGGERWARLDEVQVVEPWNRRMHEASE